MMKSVPFSGNWVSRLQLRQIEARLRCILCTRVGEIQDGGCSTTVVKIRLGERLSKDGRIIAHCALGSPRAP